MIEEYKRKNRLISSINFATVLKKHKLRRKSSIKKSKRNKAIPHMHRFKQITYNLIQLNLLSISANNKTSDLNTVTNATGYYYI